MGALHEGHLSLIRSAREECDEVVTTLFVNPLQFGPNEDLNRYPRQEALDAEMAEAAGADLLFAPSVDTMIGDTRAQVRVTGVSDLFEGAHRPGHFDGVATIVAKLFHITDPDIAYFGLKDRQQCAVIQAMTEDLNFDLKLRFMPTIREGDGLAMSSRNAYLSPEERLRAPILFSALTKARDEISRGADIAKTLEEARKQVNNAGFAIDYLELVDTKTFQPLIEMNSRAVIVVAAKLGKTRLIDNVDVPFCG